MISIFVCAQGGVLGADLHVIFVDKVGGPSGHERPQWGRDHQGRSRFRNFGFFLGWRVAVFFAAVGSLGFLTVPRGFYR